MLQTSNGWAAVCLGAFRGRSVYLLLGRVLFQLHRGSRRCPSPVFLPCWPCSGNGPMQKFLGDRNACQSCSCFRTTILLTFLVTLSCNSCSIDASSEDGTLGRLVNDAEKPNAKMKKIEVVGVPSLCLFAIVDIEEGQEIIYDYGGDNLPWRSCQRHQTKVDYI